MSSPRFSAVIPAYNATATLTASVESALAQTLADLEVVIVDDGSTDGTLELARSFERDRRVSVVTQENRGLAGARNTGIANSHGEYVGFLDSDDLWMPNFATEMTAALDADPGAGFAYTDGWALDEVSRRIRRSTVMVRSRPPMPPPREADAFLRELIKRNFIIAEGTIRRSALDKVGGYDEDLRAVEDYELWLRLIANGYRAVRPPGLLVVRRDHQTSMSKDAQRMYEAHRQAYQRVIDRHPAPQGIKAAARERIREIDRLIASEEGDGKLPLSERARRLAGRIKRRVAGDRLWYAEPPAEITQAFGDLQAL
jgi:glycosyltransferase involved in cell wall biosynthesis